ncbi:MAG: hypothetical protein GTO17_11615 [Candidatus Aminicenantes bacterium]|nr:hypothetical protein [Candidatus Aminicenantes bacterium]
MKKPDSSPGPWHYWIKLKGRLDKQWTDWFDGLTITYENDTTILKGPIADQAALYGLLIRVRDLNLPLLLVERIESSGGKNDYE